MAVLLMPMLERKMKKFWFTVCFVAGTAGMSLAKADEQITIQMNLVDEKGVGASIGEIVAAPTPYGTLFTPNLSGLPPGVHGFHLHQNAACGPGDKDGKVMAGMAAGGHYDPANSGKHEGPYAQGHVGDLPALYVTADGKATQPVLAPRLKLVDLAGHSLMIHAGGDNNSDSPQPLGGGGPRVACGVIK